MNKEEFLLFASALKTYYPRENILPNDKALELWFMQLNDIPYELAEITLNKWVATNKWSPSIADIREQAAGVMLGKDKDWGEAWGEVMASFGKYGSYRVQEALDSFDEITRKVVQQIGYKNLCFSENLTAERANFRMIYEREQERAKQDAQLPPRLKAIIENMPNMIEKGGD